MFEFEADKRDAPFGSSLAVPYPSFRVYSPRFP